MADDYIAVKYVRNADDNIATGAIKHLDDSRADIPIGGSGLVTEEEFNVLTSNGIVLEALDGDEAKEARTLSLPEGEEEQKPLHKLSNQELRGIAKAEGVDLSGLNKNSDIADAIVNAREGEGPESLPATAGRTGASAGAGLGGGAAGPGGAGGTPGTQGGGAAT